ncbi:hypothetical protein COU76_02350 [Candidatus Peregrinibacteria bacterium CG10_big_fil_rev_8_21_14_0_10_49_10]|nr:MAG: hypothetical protein COU76_02350 [Candidatus Peregrinibacteria bacterium CG10_big_fil_rev_8_21_14_0_10_49_10]
MPRRDAGFLYLFTFSPMAILTPFEENILSREVSAVHAFSDTFDANAARDASDPRTADFDAEVTTDFRSLRLTNDTKHSIARNPDLGAYAAETIIRLQDHAAGLIERIEQNGVPASAVRKYREQLQEQTRQVVVNCARRNKPGEQRTNGSDFLLGITHNGIEIYSTPAELLRFCRRDILSLFRIPNKSHPLFDGQREQFRSSIIALSRYFPEHLELLYRYSSREELLAALENGSETTIPDQKHPLQLAFADRYGNVRARARDIAHTRGQMEECLNGSGVVGIRNGHESTPIIAHVTKCLDEVPGDQIGIYHNVADGKTRTGEPGYLEIVRKFPDEGGEEEVTQDAYETIGAKLGHQLEIVAV